MRAVVFRILWLYLQTSCKRMSPPLLLINIQLDQPNTEPLFCSVSSPLRTLRLLSSPWATQETTKSMSFLCSQKTVNSSPLLGAEAPEKWYTLCRGVLGGPHCFSRLVCHTSEVFLFEHLSQTLLFFPI